MGLGHWLERKRDRLLALIAARQRARLAEAHAEKRLEENEAVARMIHSGDTAGLAAAFLQQAEAAGLLRDSRQHERRALAEHQGAEARALGKAFLEEHENRSRTRSFTPAKSRRHSNSLER